MPAPVPWEKLTEELGFPAGAAAKAKEKYRGRRGGRESASVDREPASMEALIDETTSDQVSREDLLDFVQKFKESKGGAAAAVGTSTVDGARGTPSARVTKRAGGGYGTDAQLAAEPWRRKAAVEEYKAHFTKFPGADGCCFHLVHHNFPEWRAQMAKLKKKRCPCIAGYDIRNGDQRGEDFSAQAAPAEMRRVWNVLSKLEAARVKEDAMALWLGVTGG
jgi:hypothetical protein